MSKITMLNLRDWRRNIRPILLVLFPSLILLAVTNYGDHHEAMTTVSIQVDEENSSSAILTETSKPR